MEARYTQPAKHMRCIYVQRHIESYNLASLPSLLLKRFISCDRQCQNNCRVSLNKMEDSDEEDLGSSLAACKAAEFIRYDEEVEQAIKEVSLRNS